MIFGNLRERLYIEGVMPERALLRLKRAGIAVYDVKKVEKNRILLSVKKKDSEKVFAIYPNVCYNISVYTPYTVQKAPQKGLTRLVDSAKKRVGLLLGALLFLIALPLADRFVFAVDFIGTDVYAREAYAALEEVGVQPFAPYKSGKEDLVCAKLLALDGVEFCSVKKRGLRVLVEIRTSAFANQNKQNGGMYAKHTGEIVSITVLRGTPLKKKGDQINAGELLVGDWFTTQDGGQVRVETIARARIACVYEQEIAAASAEEAFAQAYLELDLNDGCEITAWEVEKSEETENLFHVKIDYAAIEKINL